MILTKSYQPWQGLHVSQVKIPEIKTKKSVTICTVTIDIETRRIGSYTDICIPSPHWRQRHKPHSDAVKTCALCISMLRYIHRCDYGRDYSKETAISCQRSAAPRHFGAIPEDDDTIL